MAKKGAAVAASGRGPSVTYQRPKITKWSVIWGDRFANYGITFGGLLVILAVFSIMIFLFYVSAPLLSGTQMTGEKAYVLQPAPKTAVASQVDELLTVAATISPDGSIEAWHAPTGKALEAAPIDLGGAAATSVARTLRGDDVLFAFGDGTVRLGKFKLAQNLVPLNALPASLTRLDERDETDGNAVFSRVNKEQARKTALTVTMEAPVQVAPAGTAILASDYRMTGTAERPVRVFATLGADNKIRLSRAEGRVNFLTGTTETIIDTAEMQGSYNASDIAALLLNPIAQNLYVGLKDGSLSRYDIRDLQNVKLLEKVRVLPAGTGITYLGFMNGEVSIVVGGADGSVAIWFTAKKINPDKTESVTLTKVHTFESQPAAIVSMAASQRTRLFTSTDAKGNIWLRHQTTAATLLKLDGGLDPNGLALSALGVRDDAILGVGLNGNAKLWRIEAPHPETTWQTLFEPVWYEGYSEAQYQWQSTAATDAYEPKLSLVPLIFGTLKAAIYSLLLAIPIALMAAIYTSEFVSPRTKSVVKPVMELMASLPSVVVGFVAALVFSPIVENWVAAVILAFGVIPLTLVFMGLLFQLIPHRIGLYLEGLPKLFLYLLGLGLAIWGAIQLGPLVERIFFDGDFKKWTSGSGSAQPFMSIILTPVSFFLVFMIWRVFAGDRYRGWISNMSGFRAGTTEVMRWVALSAVSIGAAIGLATLITSSGYDPRGEIVGTYVQRNALVVAFAIAFAEIPLIYSIAEDALSAVPGYLRSGSLACGATQWQTTQFIVVPTAASGIFSAIMIGLGRAVGETMIVVMSTGNTPVMDINIFNGLRTLSANINVELPEAVKDSTLYRTLFLCALVLFIMTFVINTIAELVRQQYRKRAAQL